MDNFKPTNFQQIQNQHRIFAPLAQLPHNRACFFQLFTAFSQEIHQSFKEKLNQLAIRLQPCKHALQRLQFQSQPSKPNSNITKIKMSGTTWA
jgi:hypothetical protein